MKGQVKRRSLYNQTCGCRQNEQKGFSRRYMLCMKKTSFLQKSDHTFREKPTSVMLTSDVLYNSKTNTDLQLQSCLSVWRLIGDQFDMSPLSPSHFITGSTEAKQKYSTWSGIKHTHLAGEHFQSSCTFDRCTRCFTKIWLSGAGKSMI